MNKWMKRIVACGFILAQFLVIPTVQARSLEDIENEQETVEEEVNQLQEEVSNRLAEASELSVSLNDLNQEIEEHKATISETEEDIKEQEAHVQERYEYTADQLTAMQKSEINQNIVLRILQAESITELFNAIYSASILTGASEDRLAEAQAEKEKLDDLNEKLLAHQEELDSKQTETVQQKEALDNKVADLKSTLAVNQDELEQLNTEAAEAQRAAEREAERVTITASNSETDNSSETNEASESDDSNEQAETNEANETTETVTTTVASEANDSNDSNSSNEESNNESESTNTSQAGAWMSMQATGYSTQQPGLSTHTAQGIDLRVNPNVIAVDPSVIPLGSLVEVQGQGVYIAGDTGGAINGNIIDIHFPTVDQALSWGRRTVNVRIIN